MYIVMCTFFFPIDDSRDNLGHETASTAIHVRTDSGCIKNTRAYRAI